MLSNKAVPIEYEKFRTAVLQGLIPVNAEISMQMNRIDERILSKDYYYDDQAIIGFVNFCERELTLTDGSDVTLLPSFKLWAEDLLAWFYFEEEWVYNPNTKKKHLVVLKRRLTNKQIIINARGSAKSIFASYIQAYFLVVDVTTTHQIIVAPTMKQAEETIGPIRTAIARSRGPVFKFLTQGSLQNTNGPRSQRQQLASTKKGIENFLTNSLIEVRPMRIDKLQGLRPKVTTIDEWLSGEVKEDVIGAIEQGASKIDDYIILATSSEGTSRNGVGDTAKLEYHAILRGEYSADNVSIWHYKLDNVQEVNDPEMWEKANSNIGLTISYSAYHRDVARAEANPSARNDILAKRFGIPMEGSTYFFTYEETIRHRHQNYKSMDCALGGDMSQGDDFCAFTAMFPLGRGRYGLKCRSYVSESKVKKLPEALYKKYQKFIEEGSVIVMPGTILDMMDVYDDLDEWIIQNDYNVACFGYDPYNADEFVKRWIRENGEFGVEKVIQGSRTESVPMGEIKKLAEERMLVFDEELFEFSMGNAIAIEDPNGNRKLSKRRSSEKIDNVAALLDCWIAYKKNTEVF